MTEYTHPIVEDAFKQEEYIETEKMKMQRQRQPDDSLPYKKPFHKESFYQKVEASVLALEEYVRPTFDAQNQEITQEEIKERIYRKLNHNFRTYNECTERVFDEEDFIKCETGLLNYLKEGAFADAKKILLDY